MTDYVSPYTHIMFDRDGARVKSFATAYRAKATVITVQIEVTSSYALAGILTSLHEAKEEGERKPAPKKPKAADPLARIEQQRALPAPPPRLPYFPEG